MKVNTEDRTPEEQNLTIAHHEAGHAVAGIAHGGTVEYVTVEDPYECVWADGSRSVDRITYAMYTHAGPQAQARYTWLHTKPEWDEDPDEFADLEYHETNAYVGNQDGDIAELEAHGLMTERYTEASQSFVTVYWPQIEAVALALAEAGTLTGEQVVKIMRGSS